VADTSLDIDELLEAEGFDSPAARAAARLVLEAERLTRPGKGRIDASKRERVLCLLAERCFVSCGAADCEQMGRGRLVVRSVRPESCAGCGGSVNRRAIQAAEQAFARAGIAKVVVVGGSPGLHTELRRIKSPDWALRLVDGTGRRTLEQARADGRWADLVLIWGATQLDHKVSNLYQAECPRERVVQTARRGLAALFDEALKHALRR
jgi:hypothetical protein